MNQSATWQNLASSWDDSNLAASARACARAWQQSHLQRFVLGPSLEQQTRFFQQSATYRTLAAIAASLMALFRHCDSSMERVTAYSLTCNLVRWVVAQSYLLLALLGGYPLIDYFIRKAPLISRFAGIWDDLLLCFTALLVMLRLIINRKDRYFFTPVDLPLLLFLGTSLMLFLFRSPETVVAIDGWRATCEFVFWYYLAANLLLDLKRQRVVLWSLVGVAALVALYGVYQYIIKVPIPPQWVDQAELGVRTRVFSFIGSPNILGSYLVLTIPIAVALFQTTRAIRPRIILSGCLLLMLACLVFTFSRGAWLAFAVAAIIYALLQDRRILILLLAGAIMLPVLSPSVAGRIEYAFSSQYLQSSAKGGRVVRWQMAIDRLATHPLVGVGLGRFGGATAARFDVPGNYYVDNYFMKLTVEMGLIGLAAFIWLLLNVLRLLAGLIRKTARDPARFPLACAIAAGVIGVIAHNGVENVFEVPMMQALFWGLLGLAARLSLAPVVEPNAIKAKV